MAVTINGDGLVDVGGTSTSQGRVRLAEDTDNGTNYIELTAPASVASNKTITFPDLTGTVLTTATAGAVLQVVQNGTVGSSSTSSTTYVDVTNYSVSITPSSTSNKILIIASSKHQYTLVAATNVLSYQRLLRGSTALVDDVLFGAEAASGGLQAYGMITFSYLDSPSTTSSTTYKVQQHSGNASSTSTTNSGWIIAMEIAA